MFEDRRDAGRALAAMLAAYVDVPGVLVLALPRGGVPVGYEVARVLHAPLDLFVVRKLGTPGQEELAFGAIASGGVRILNSQVVNAAGVALDEIERITRREWGELARRERQYRGERPFPEIEGRVVILVDDGLATGSTMRAAAAALRQRNPARLLIAVPVAAPETCHSFRAEGIEVVCALTPEGFCAVGQWYRSFPQTSDAEVHRLLQQAGEVL